MNAVVRSVAPLGAAESPARHVLVVEDDAALRDALVDTLRFAGFRVTAAADGAAALAALETSRPGLVLSDVQMVPVDGHELLLQVRARWPEVPVVLITAYGTIERAVAAMRDGAADYLVKPFDAEALIGLVERIGRADEPGAEDDAPVAADPRSAETLALARRIARTDVTVLITGESGTGKEVFARYLHARSARRDGPFVAINCAAIPESMLEAVLFGHEKGAFTGASAAHAGKFEQAQGGTLLLDEISEMGLSLQAKLLRVLQEREVERIGGTRTIKLDVRVIATSNRDLELAVRDGTFREDLFYRLSVFPLKIPPLRERPGDVVALAQRFVAMRAVRPLPLSAGAMARLTAHSWPGNVRELENVMQRALLLSEGEPQIEAQHLGLVEVPGRDVQTAARAPSADLAGEMWEEETRRIVTALEMHRGVRKQAAEQLGISDRTLRYKLQKMRAAGLRVPGDRV